MVVLIVANLVPLIGAVAFDWDVASILLLYWSENVIIGFYTALKMAIAPMPVPPLHLAKLFMIPFFIVHFGGFCFGHLMFLLIFLGGGHAEPSVERFRELLPPGVLWPVLGLFVSHGVSFVHNHLLRGEYRRLPLPQLMIQPYGRIILLHVAIIAGGMPVMLLGSPTPLLVILVLFKIVMDVVLHVRSHRKAAETDGADDVGEAGAEVDGPGGGG